MSFLRVYFYIMASQPLKVLITFIFAAAFVNLIYNTAYTTIDYNARRSINIALRVEDTVVFVKRQETKSESENETTESENNKNFTTQTSAFDKRESNRSTENIRNDSFHHKMQVYANKKENTTQGTISKRENISVTNLREMINTSLGNQSRFMRFEYSATEYVKPSFICPYPRPQLGPIRVDKTEYDLELVDKKFPEVQQGGRYRPTNCTVTHKVAIIVPYRDRKENLAVFLNHMHPFLMTQQVEYGIFIIEQKGIELFNRAKLMNVGFVESQKLRVGGWQCFFFHDVDLLPVDLRNMYTCPRQPRHMSVAIDTMSFKLPYDTIFGGVSAMTKEQFEAVNGFSNQYWGWGAEDDDMSYRIMKQGFSISRYKMSIARYTMLDHGTTPLNPRRKKLLKKTMNLKDLVVNEGLSTLDYEVDEIIFHHLYTHVIVSIDRKKETDCVSYIKEFCLRVLHFAGKLTKLLDS